MIPSEKSSKKPAGAVPTGFESGEDHSPNIAIRSASVPFTQRNPWLSTDSPIKLLTMLLKLSHIQIRLCSYTHI